MDVYKCFIELTTKGIPFAINYIALYSINQTPDGVLVNGVLVDQKFSDIINTLESIGVKIVSIKET